MEFFIPFIISCVLAVIIKYFIIKSDKDYYESEMEKIRKHFREMGVPKRGDKDFEEKADAFLEYCKSIVDTSNEKLSKLKNNKSN